MMDMWMSIIITLICIIMMGYFLWDYLKIHSSAIPLITIMFYVLVLYGFALCKLLRCGVLVCYTVTIVSFVYTIIKNKRTEKLKCYMTSVGVVALLWTVMVSTVLFTVVGLKYKMWDEFAIWGPFFKSIKETGTLSVYTGEELIKMGWPQAVAIFYYFSSFFMKEFTELSSLVMLTIFIHAAVISVFGEREINVKNKNFWLLFLALPFVLTLFPLVKPYGTAYQDALVGAVFGAILIFIYLCKKDNKRHIIALSICLAGFVQIKGEAVIFAIFSLVSFVIHLSCQEKKDSKKIINVRVLVPMLATVLSWGSWQAVCIIKNVEETKMLLEDFSAIKHYVAGALDGTSQHLGYVWDKFVNGAFSIPTFIGIVPLVAMLGTMVVITVLCVLMVCKIPNKKYVEFEFGVLIVYFIVYIVLLFGLYLCTKTSVEIEVMNSFDRYISTFLVSWCMLFGAICLNEASICEQKIKRWNIEQALPVVVALMVIVVLFAGDPMKIKNSKQLEERVTVENITREIEQIVDENQKILIFSAHDSQSELRKYQFKFLFDDVEIEYSSDIINVEETQEEIELSGDIKAEISQKAVDYVLTTSVDENAQASGVHLFSKEGKRIYSSCFK